MAAIAMELIVTPVSSNVKDDIRRPSAAIETTTAIVIAAPMKAAGQTAGKTPIVCHPKQIAVTAPSAAPLWTPSVNGVARASRNRAWNTTPASANAPPANAAKITRGRRA